MLKAHKIDTSILDDLSIQVASAVTADETLRKVLTAAVGKAHFRVRSWGIQFYAADRTDPAIVYEGDDLTEAIRIYNELG